MASCALVDGQGVGGPERGPDLEGLGGELLGFLQAVVEDGEHRPAEAVGPAEGRVRHAFPGLLEDPGLLVDPGPVGSFEQDRAKRLMGAPAPRRVADLVGDVRRLPDRFDAPVESPGHDDAERGGQRDVDERDWVATGSHERDCRFGEGAPLGERRNEDALACCGGEESGPSRGVPIAQGFEGAVDHGELVGVCRADARHEAAVVGKGGPGEELGVVGGAGEAGRFEERLAILRCAGLLLRGAEPEQQLGATVGVRGVEELDCLPIPTDGLFGGERGQGDIAGTRRVVDGLGCVGRPPPCAPSDVPARRRARRTGPW